MVHNRLPDESPAPGFAEAIPLPSFSKLIIDSVSADMAAGVASCLGRISSKTVVMVNAIGPGLNPADPKDQQDYKDGPEHNCRYISVRGFA